MNSPNFKTKIEKTRLLVTLHETFKTPTLSYSTNSSYFHSSLKINWCKESVQKTSLVDLQMVQAAPGQLCLDFVGFIVKWLSVGITVRSSNSNLVLSKLLKLPFLYNF